MTTTVAIGARPAAVRPSAAPRTTIALLGCGTVGSALVRLLSGSQPPGTPRIAGALVRNPEKRRPLGARVPLTAHADALFDRRPCVVVELLGGVEPARTLVLDALDRGIPVVTANKSLLARCGADLRAAARATGTPLFYEAAVIAGVPFLGTFARRPRAAAVAGIQAILNGTSNYVLTRCTAESSPLADALLDAQRLGYAERDPRNDITGIDAAEKLAVLLQQFAGREVAPDAIETDGIQRVTPGVIDDAREFGGTVKPVALAEWDADVRAYVGPAFVPACHPLAGVAGVDNAVLLDSAHGRLRFQGPGAGPEVTAATVLDDVAEIAAGCRLPTLSAVTPATPLSPATGWLVAIEHHRVPDAPDLADDLARHGVFVKRTAERRSSSGRAHQGFLTWPAERGRIELALSSISRSSGYVTAHLRALERASGIN